MAVVEEVSIAESTSETSEKSQKNKNKNPISPTDSAEDKKTLDSSEDCNHDDNDDDDEDEEDENDEDVDLVDSVKENKKSSVSSTGNKDKCTSSCCPIPQTKKSAGECSSTNLLRVGLLMEKRVPGAWKKSDAMDCLFWLKIGMSVAMGIVIGFLGLQGITGFMFYVSILMLAVRQYREMLRVPEDVLENGEALTEGMMPAVALFVLTWTGVFTLLNA